MLILNLDAETEQTLTALAQTQQQSIEQVLAEALKLYRDEEQRENNELNALASTRMNDGRAFIAVSLDDL
ncbi:hypothetical protein [Methylocucumis oryzae]|uniref:Uncharacterized protein n=1 Tax=Methylocucumis oryzae TaxID=1632867 RepID=A0A0F3ILK1_9GAMM|nr:hypothetical protein [Methylocucumis oryzae]KJV07591.1 hypothetical protein VZ94_03650 [Methylocucumis oryzae]